MFVTIIFEDDSPLTDINYTTVPFVEAAQFLHDWLNIRRVKEVDNNVIVVYYDSMLMGARVTLITHNDRYDEGYRTGRRELAEELHLIMKVMEQ